MILEVPEDPVNLEVPVHLENQNHQYNPEDLEFLDYLVLEFLGVLEFLEFLDCLVIPVNPESLVIPEDLEVPERLEELILSISIPPNIRIKIYILN